MGMDRRDGDRERGQNKEVPLTVSPPTNDEKLRTIFLHQLPESVGSNAAVERLLGAVGRLRRWDAYPSGLDGQKGSKFGFAWFEDMESLAIAIRLLVDNEVELPEKRQPGTAEPPAEADFEGIAKVTLQVTVDPNTIEYLDSWVENRGDSAGLEKRVEGARSALKATIRGFFYPSLAATNDRDGDVEMGDGGAHDHVEVVNISLAQDDELADIPAELREVVAGEIAAFRDRSNRRDMERLKREEEMEEMERTRGGPRPSRLDSPPPGGANSIPVGPRGSVPNAPSGPKGQMNNRSVSFVNGAMSNDLLREDEDTDADDDELNRRQEAKQKSDADRLYSEAERKWANRERSRQAALERERDREQHDKDSFERRKQEQLDHERAWDDEKEASRKSHPYYRDQSGWLRKRLADRADEEARDESDRRTEREERRREDAQMERARGMADSFLDQTTHEMEQEQQTRTSAAVSAPQPFKLSLGAAAQKAQASRAGQRRTIADVEGLLDDEEADSATKRQLIPIQLDAMPATASMTDEEISQAVRALAQEIPSGKDALWKWEVKWDHMDNAVVKDKLRPFVEKKIVEYLGVQEEMLVETVEEHLRRHGTAAALAEELEGVSTFLRQVMVC